MSAVRPDGVGAPHPEAIPSGRKRPVSIPWREIARRLAEGARPASVAADLDLNEDRIWRHLRRSLRFRFYLRQAIERQRMLAGLQLAALGQSALLARGLQPESLDGDLLRLLNEAAPDSDLAQQIEQLGGTGQSPPNMALRRRLTDKIAAQNAQFEAFRAQDAARMAAIRAPSSQTDGPPRTETNRNEPERAQTNLNEPLRSATNTSEPERTPRPRPASPPAEPPPRAVVDLDGPDLARLRAQGLLGAGRPPDS
jgi:hypothetical protein